MRKSIAAAVTVTIGLILATPASALGEVSDADAVEFMPGLISTVSQAFSDEALFSLSPEDETDETQGPWRDSLLFTRSLTEDDTTVTLGRATRVARASGYAMAEHDGTLAYLRRVDGRLVLRAPDGTETMPAWGTAAMIVGNGPSSMSSMWLAAAATVYDRQSGAAYDLLDSVTDLPDGTTETWAEDVSVLDDRALWTVGGMYGDWDNPTGWYEAVYTVALGASGPEGPALRLDFSDSAVWLTATGIVGSRLVWNELTEEGDIGAGTSQTTLTVRSVPVSSPESAPSERVFGAQGSYPGVFDAGDEVAVQLTDPTTMVWFDPADPSTDVRTSDVGAFLAPTAVSGSLVAFLYWGADSVPYLFDADGRAITADDSLPVPAATFPDVAPSNPFVADISWLTDLGITRGYADGTFRPAGTVSRDAMAAFLYRFAGEPTFTAPATSPFLDVATTHPFYKEISWLAYTGISTGTVTPAGAYYKPGDSVSREAMAAFLYRFAGEPDFTAPATSPFLDVATTHPFYQAISWLADTGISTGTVTPAGAYYKPGDPVSREAMAAFLHRMHTGGYTIPWGAVG